MKNNRCWLWHTWTKWEDLFEEVRPQNHNHQIKTCLKCGIKKMRWFDNSHYGR